MRRPWVWLLASLALIVVLAFPALNLKMLGSTAKLLPQDAESRARASTTSTASSATTRSTRSRSSLKTEPGGVFTPKFLTGLDKLTNTLAADRAHRTA